MKNFILILSILFSAFFSFAQENNFKLPEFQIPQKPGYYISGEMQEGAVFIYKIRNEFNSNVESFTVKPNTLARFSENFKLKFNSICKQEDEKIENSENDSTIIEETFNMFIVSSIAVSTYEYEPVAGKLCFNNKININIYNDKEFDKQIEYYFDDLSDTIEYEDITIIRHINKRNNIIKNRYHFKESTEKLKYFKFKKQLKDKKIEKKDIKKIKKLVKDSEFCGKLEFEYLGYKSSVDNLQIRKGYFWKKTYSKQKWSSYKNLKRAKEKIKEELLINLNKQLIDKYDSVKKRLYAKRKDYKLQSKKYHTALAEYSKSKKELDSISNNIKDTISAIEKKIDKLDNKYENIKNEIEKQPEKRNYIKIADSLNNIISSLEKDTSKINSAKVKIKYVLNDKLALFNIKSIVKHNGLQLADSILKNRKLMDYNKPYIYKINNLDSTEIDSLYKNNRLIDFINANKSYSKDLKESLQKEINKIKDTISILEIILKSTEQVVKNASIEKIVEEKKKIKEQKKEQLKNSLLSINKELKQYKNDSIKAYNRILFIDADIENVQVEFQNGFIENICVVCKVDSSYSPNKSGIVKFENRYPIGFTRKTDFQIIKKKSLFYGNKSEDNLYELKLKNLFSQDFIQEHVTDRRDYSPKDGVVNFTDRNNLCKNLRKEKTNNLFDIKVFTDFAGFKNENPNGLVQTELSRKVLLYTNRRYIGNQLKTNIGGLAYFHPEFIYSKYEDNKKSFLLNRKDNFINNQYSPTRYISTLNLKKYETYNIGFDINAFVIDAPELASTLYLDLGFRYGRTELKDSVTVYENNIIRKTNELNEFGVNTFRFYPKVTWEIKGDERFSSKLTWKLNHFYLRENEENVIQVANDYMYENTENVSGNILFHTISLLFRYKPEAIKKSYFFFRYNFNYKVGYWNTNFHQLQFGYSIHLKGLTKK